MSPIDLAPGATAPRPRPSWCRRPVTPSATSTNSTPIGGSTAARRSPSAENSPTRSRADRTAAGLDAGDPHPDQQQCAGRASTAAAIAELEVLADLTDQGGSGHASGAAAAATAILAALSDAPQQ